jgi:hypothetical protein
MAKLHHALLALFTAIVLVVGCAKTVEGETKAWNDNVAQLNALIAQYPGFKPALEARLAAAKKTYDAASTMSGDPQIEQMAKANSEINAGFVTDLKGLDAKIKKLRESSVEVAAKAGDDSSRLGAKIAAENAQKSVASVEKLLATGAKDEAAATAVLKKAVGDLDSAQSAIDKVSAVDKDKGDKKAADEKAATDKATTEKAAAEAKVADWTCEYCNTPNKADVGVCSSCGAPKAAPK